MSGPVTVGVMGFPVGHTVSPVMHRAAALAAGIDLVYGSFEVHPDDLRAAVEGIRALGMAGANVTVPHKVAITDFLDELEPSARKIGAVNCIVNRAGTMAGHNTDAAGFAGSLRVQVPGMAPRRPVVLGAGGSARAVAFALAKGGAEVRIWARDESKARGLAADLDCGLDGTGESVTRLDLGEAASEADLIVNCTPVGMRGGPTGELPIDCRRLNSECVVFDLVYNPVKTPLLQEAEAAGLRGVNGLRMLAEQAALSFELWAGRKADPQAMERAALCALCGE